MVQLRLWLASSLCLLVAAFTAPTVQSQESVQRPQESFVLSTSVSAASASEPFELGGQVLYYPFADPADEMHRAGMTWLKMQIVWLGGGTGDAQNVINEARRQGFKVLVAVRGHNSAFNSSTAIDYYNSFANFLGQVAALGPDAIEVWNEPNIDREWPAGLISGGEYTKMLRRAYNAIKRANPNVMVISGAPAPTGFFGGRCQYNGCDDLPFIQQMAAAGAANYFDCTGIHYNEGILPPSASSGDPRGDNHYTRYYPTMVSTYRNVFPTKPLCFTEIGYLSPEGYGSLPAGFGWAAGTSVQEHAQWIAQAAQIARNSGIVRLMIVWNVDSRRYDSDPQAGWAIIRPGGSCPACNTLGRVMEEVPRLNYYTSNRARLSWNRITWATGYHLQVDTDPQFAAPIRWARTVDSSVLAINSIILEDGTYYWRVRAIRSDGTFGAWSTVQTFTLNAP